MKRRPGVELFADVPDVRPFLATVRDAGRAAADRRRVAAEDSRSAGRRDAGGQHAGRGRGARARAPAAILRPAHAGRAAAAKILEAIRRPDDAQELAENGRRGVLARYSWGPLAVRLEEVWQDAARRIGANRRVSSLTN